MTLKEEIKRKEIKYGLPAEIQEEVWEKYCNYITITPEEWIDLLGNFEAIDDRSRAACESQIPTTKKKKADHPGGDDSSSKSRFRFPSKEMKV